MSSMESGSSSVTSTRFPSERGHYLRYGKAGWRWNEVMTKLQDMEGIKGRFRLISREYGIKIKTLYDRYKQWKATGDSRDDDRRKGNRRVFSDEQEMELAEKIKSEYLDEFRPLVNEDISLMAEEMWDESHQQVTRSTKPFRASIGWLSRFKKVHRFSSRRPTPSKIANNVNQESEEQEYLKECKEWLERVGPKYFLNMDETAYWMVNPVLRTIAAKGTENVRVKQSNNVKKKVTLILTIAANGASLKPVIVEKGKTQRCIKKFRIRKGKMLATMSKSGWTEVPTMTWYMANVVAKYTQGKPACLVLDQYSTHKMDEVKEFANGMNLHLIYVPAGSTGSLQPLDVGINGIVKSKAKRLWRLEMLKKDQKLDWATITKHIQTIWYSMEKSTIVGAFRRAKILE
jgi:transposase